MQVPVTLKRISGWVSEFKAFILRGDIVDPAIGIVVGAAFGIAFRDLLARGRA